MHDLSEKPHEPENVPAWPALLFLLAVAGGLGLAAILNVEPLLSANDRSRWTTVWSLAERDTYQIDEIIQHPGWDTIDKVRHEEHFYSSKPPLLPRLVAGIYLGIKKVTGWTLLEETKAVVRTILILINLLPWLVALWVLGTFLRRRTSSGAAWWLLMTAATFGTYLSAYLVTFNNHSIAATCVVFSLLPAIRIVCEGNRQPWLFATAGFFAAFACTNELPAALWGVMVFGLLVWQSPRNTALFFVPMALIPLVGYFWTNYEATGGLEPFYAHYGTEKYEYVHEGVPSYWSTPKGIDANVEPWWLYLWHCTFGHHGLFSLTPLFLLTLWGWLSVRSWKRDRLWPIQTAGIVLSLVVLLFYLSRTENYNYGGNTAGLRWTFWLIPFWLLGTLPVVNRFANRRWFQGVAGLLLAGSVFSMASAVSNPWQPSWLYSLMKQWDWINYDTPPPPLPRPLTTWFSTLPPVGLSEPAWMEFSSPNADGTLTILRLEDGGRLAGEKRAIRQVVATWKFGSGRRSTETYHLDEDRFDAGAMPRTFLVWPEGVPDWPTQWRADTFLRNLPHPRPYNADHVRYLKTPLRRDAFRCQQAASRVGFTPPGGSRKLIYRSDVWISDQVPFGVLRFQTIVSDPATGDTVEYRRFDVSNASWYYDSSPSQ